MKNILIIISILFLFSCGNQETKPEEKGMKLAAAVGVGNSSYVSTFQCIGLYWSGSGQTGTCNVQYRVSGESNWTQGYPLWYDSRSIGGRPAEYRGSIVGLKSGTQYEIQLTAGSATNSFTAATWSENFPVGSTTNLSGSTTISTSGTATAYRVYTGSINGGSNNLVINASYIIIRNMTLTGATNDAIELGQNAHDVIIEGCDISGWGQSASTLGGNNQAAVRVRGFSYNGKGVQRIVIQRNKIHDPRYSASGWSTETGGDHPYGVNGINFEESGGNHVIRYNDIYGDQSANSSKRFMDGIGGADNFTTTGFPGANSDIYSNTIRGCFDDGIEAEGGGQNVRIWGNFLNYTFTGIATATVSVGPCYVWNNLTNVGMRMQNQSSTEDRGPFNKCGTQESNFRGGRTYLFHNTVLQPSGNRGLCGGIIDNGGPVTNVISKNNIWTSAYTSKGGVPIGLYQGSGSVNSENDLLSPNQTSGSVTKTGTITGNPSYVSTVGLELNPAGYFLAAGNGKGKAVGLPGFNSGAGVDIGAYNSANKLEFGINAYTGTTPPEPPQNQLPSANAGSDRSIQLPTNSTTLNGSGSDPDGTISTYNWTRISGPAQYTFGSASSATTTVSNLVAGTYVFQLLVTDNKNGQATDNVTVTVLAENVPPPIKFLVRVEVTYKSVYSDSTTSQTTTVIK